MSLFGILLLNGIIEGLTEFIPVSSTGHLIVLEYVVSLPINHPETFQISIQLGAILAACVHYRKTFRRCVLQCKENTRFLMALCLAMLPVFVLGFLAYKPIKALLFHPVPVAIALIGGGVVMILVDRFVTHRPSTSEVLDPIDHQPSAKQALIIGCVQCASLWPGMSRSGSTIVGGVLSGLRYQQATDFSFILGVPVIGAAVLYDLTKTMHVLTLADVNAIAVGFIMAFFVGMIAIRTVLGIIGKWRLSPFGWYRIVLGLGVLCL